MLGFIPNYETKHLLFYDMFAAKICHILKGIYKLTF